MKACLCVLDEFWKICHTANVDADFNKLLMAIKNNLFILKTAKEKKNLMEC